MLNIEHKYKKKILRKFLIDRRNEYFSLFEKKNNSHIHIKTLLENIETCYVGSYFAFRNEIITNSIHKLLLSLDFKICLPCVSNQDSNMIFRSWDLKDQLIKDKFGIMQPKENTKEVVPELIIVPIVGFSISGYRLGYGGGYYDRYIQSRLTDDSLITVGLGYTFQEVKDIPYEKHDQKLNWILTEKYLYKVV